MGVAAVLAGLRSTLKSGEESYQKQQELFSNNSLTLTVSIQQLHHVQQLMRDERKKGERSKQGQTNNKAKQHSTPKAVTFPKKNELSRVGLEPTTLYTLDRALYHVYTVHVHIHVLYVCIYTCTCTV